MQDKLIKINFSDYLGKDIAFNSIKYDKAKEFAILDDIEEKWGTWLKENGLENDSGNINENEIKEKYNLFEENIENYYTQEYEKLNLLNPFNYIKGRQYTKSIEQDKDDICFISHYYKGLYNVDGSKDESDKKGAVDKINKTITIIQNNIIPQIQGISILSNYLRINSEKLNELERK